MAHGEAAMSVAYGKGTRAKATKLHSQIVRARGHCERCGVVRPPAELQCGHIVRRTHSWTRTDTLNAWALCPACHFKVDADPYEFMQLVDRTIGQEFYMALRRKAFEGVKAKFDWDAELERLQGMWAAIEAAA